jgi:hypothetical protein
VELERGLRGTRGRCRQEREGGEGAKGSERVVEKAAGDECAFIPGEGTGLADEVGSDTIPDTAGGEGVTGAAKPDSVIHGYVSNRLFIDGLPSWQYYPQSLFRWIAIGATDACGKERI